MSHALEAQDDCLLLKDRTHHRRHPPLELQRLLLQVFGFRERLVCPRQTEELEAVDAFGSHHIEKMEYRDADCRSGLAVRMRHSKQVDEDMMIATESMVWIQVAGLEKTA